MNKKLLIIVLIELALLFAFLTISYAQSPSEKYPELFEELKEKDSLIFHASFVSCDLELLEGLILDDLEFYHDIAGVMKTSISFLENTRTGLCASKFALERRLSPGTLKVFPLEDGGKLYGAIQTGEHTFWEANDRSGPFNQTGVALFTHLWLWKDDEWRLSRVLSYDHRAAGG